MLKAPSVMIGKKRLMMQLPLALNIWFAPTCWIANAVRLTIIKKLADKLNKAGEITKKAGIQLCYHNHDFEFASQDGKYPYEALLNFTDADLVKMEMDLYWMYKAKQDPIAMFKNIRAVSRYGMLRIWITPQNKCLPRWVMVLFHSKRSLNTRKESGLKYFFNEQDVCPGDPFVSITKSYNYIKANNLHV
jgi:hypothetical protein